MPATPIIRSRAIGIRSMHQNEDRAVTQPGQPLHCHKTLAPAVATTPAPGDLQRNARIIGRVRGTITTIHRRALICASPAPRSTVAGAALAIALAGSGAWAQSTPGTRHAPAEKPEIEVIGQPAKASLADKSDAGSRLGLSILDTPATVSQMSGADIRLRDDNYLNEAVTRAVGVTTQAGAGNGYTGLAARGFSSSSISVLYNGTKSLVNIGSGTFPYDLWNVEKIEVLNGPASVLFGGGAIGGAVNVVPRVPEAKPSTTVRLSAGSFNTFREALDSTGAVADGLLYRLDVSHQSSDGYVDHGQSQSTAVTAAVSYEISPSLKLSLADDFSHNTPMIYNGLPLINGAVVPALRRVNYIGTGSRIRFNDNWAHATLAWTPSAEFMISNTVSLITGQRLWKYPSQFNYQPASNTVLVGNYASYQQRQIQANNHLEARWRKPLLGLPNTLSFGMDGDYLDNIRRQHVSAGTTTTDLYNTSPAAYIEAPYTPTDQRMYVVQLAPFAEDRLEVLPALSLSGGLRFDRLHLRRLDLVTQTEVSKLYTSINWRVGAVYEVAPKLNLYAQYSKAVDPVANLCCITVAQTQYALSSGRQVEAGIKQSALGGRLEWSLAGYRITKNNLLQASPDNPNVTVQVGAQSSYGAEATLSLAVTPALQIRANGTVLHVQYDKFTESVAGVAVSRAGLRPPGVPQQSANVWAIWNATGRFQLQAGLRYVGKTFIDTANTQPIASYTVADAGIGYRMSSRLVAQVHVSNLFDRLYATNYVSNGRGGGQLFLAAPRSANVVLSAGF